MKQTVTWISMVSALIVASVVGTAAQQGPLAWAYPLAPAGAQRPPDPGTVKSVPGSTLRLTQTAIDDPFAPPDWFPTEHPRMPPSVASGRKPDARACGQCHMPHGLGHPESSGLAGLPASYIVEQVNAYRTGARKSFAGTQIMTQIAKALTDEELTSAAAYFASLRAKRWTKVVETTTVPKTYTEVGNMRFADESGAKEPIGTRVIELPQDPVQARLRNSHSGFVAYVPVGAIKKGEALVKTGGARMEKGVMVPGKTLACPTCHGPDLRGMTAVQGAAVVPSIAGRSPIYLARQIYDIQQGVRTGPLVELMKPVVAQLTEEDIVNIVAYLGSVNP